MTLTGNTIREQSLQKPPNDYSEEEEEKETS